MAIDLLKIGKVLFPEASDQEIMQEIQSIKAEDPELTDEDILVAVLQELKQSKGN